MSSHQTNVLALSFLQNDGLLVSSSADKPARLWDLDTNLPFLQHEDVVFNATFSADGKLLATGYWDKNAYI